MVRRVGFHACYGDFRFLGLKIIYAVRYLVSPRSTPPNAGRAFGVDSLRDEPISYIELTLILK